MKCHGCGQEDDLRLGYCFDCAQKGEERAAKRTVIQHILNAMTKIHHPKRWWQLKYDLKWALERATRTGNYADGGVFDREGYQWRK